MSSQTRQNGVASEKAGFTWVIVAGIIVGCWHASLASRGLFTFRSDVPFTALAAVILGPLSTLPAVILALFSPRWSTVWLIGGGFTASLSVVVETIRKGTTADDLAWLLLSLLVGTTGPMIALGLGVVWFHHRLGSPAPANASVGGHVRNRFGAILVGYILVSLGALFVAEWPLFMHFFETPAGLCILSLLLGPLIVLAVARPLGIAPYLFESVLVLGFLWLAMTNEERRKNSLLAALITWLASGLFVIAITGVFR